MNIITVVGKYHRFLSFRRRASVSSVALEAAAAAPDTADDNDEVVGIGAEAAELPLTRPLPVNSRSRPPFEASDVVPGALVRLVLEGRPPSATLGSFSSSKRMSLKKI